MLVGHRGMGEGVVDGHVENTVDSFLAAADAGLRWVEMDVQRTADDDLLVRHDSAMPDGTFLADMTSEDAVRAGAVRLADVLNALPLDLGVVLDVKSSLDDAARPAEATTAALLAARSKRLLRGRPAVAVTFDPGALVHMRELAPDLARGLLTWFRFPIGHAVAAAAHLDLQVLAVHAGSMWPHAATGRADIPELTRIVEAVHATGRQLLVWCPSKRRARALAAAGKDAMVVDDVPRLVEARARWRR